MPSPSFSKKIGDSAELLKECDAFEEELAHLRASYEQYFLGIERRQPDAKHREVKNRINALRATFVKSTAVKFRIQSLWTKYLSFDRLWQRTLREMEAGTYRRDIFRAKLRQKKASADANAKTAAAPATAATPAEPDVDEVDDVAAALQAAVNGAPSQPSGLSAALEAAARGKPTAAGTQSFRAAQANGHANAPSIPAMAPAMKPLTAPAPQARAAAAPGGLSDDKVRAIYDAYISAKKKNNEDVSKLSYDSVAQNLRKQVPELMKKHNAQSVEFKVVVKDGKTQLRAVPKAGG